MNRLKIYEVLEFLNGELDARFQGAAAFSMIPGKYLLVIKQADGSSQHIVSDNPEDIVSKFVDVVEEQKREAALIEDIYSHYPRKRDVAAARIAIKRALSDPEIPVGKALRGDFLRWATHIYAQHCQTNGTTADFVPYPSTWYNRKSYLNGAKTVLELLKQGKRPPSAK